MLSPFSQTINWRHPTSNIGYTPSPTSHLSSSRMGKQWGMYLFTQIHSTLAHLSSLSSKSLHRKVPWLIWPNSLNSSTQWALINCVPGDFALLCALAVLFYEDVYFSSSVVWEEELILLFFLISPTINSDFCVEDRPNTCHWQINVCDSPCVWTPIIF